MSLVTEQIELSNGLKMPVLGLGSFDGFTHTPEALATAKEAVRVALSLGYRLIDSADAYGNEGAVGDGIHQFLAENPSAKRSDIFLTSKVFIYDLHREGVRAAVNRSLERLKTDYLDLYLIHFPVSLKKTEAGDVPSGIPLIEAWRALEELVDEGKLKSIGVSNYNVKQLKELLSEARIKPVVNQVECNPLLNQSKLLHFCKENNIRLEAYSPLGKANSKYPTKSDLLNNPELLRIAEKHHTTPAAIALKWQLQRGVTVIPKSVSPERIKANIHIGDLHLTEEDIQAINALHTGYRIVSPPFMKFEEDD